MKEKTETTCLDCDAVYTTEHDLDPDIYTPKYCQFCGAELDSEMVERFEFDEDEDEWTEKST